MRSILATQAGTPWGETCLNPIWTDRGNGDKLLEQLQPLFGALATRNGDAALAELGLLAERLRAQDIQMLLADDTTADCFTLYDGDADSYVTVTPAIAVRGKLRVRGEARRPRDTEARGDVVADAGDPPSRKTG